MHRVDIVRKRAMPHHTATNKGPMAENFKCDDFQTISLIHISIFTFVSSACEYTSETTPTPVIPPPRLSSLSLHRLPTMPETAPGEGRGRSWKISLEMY